MEVKNIKVTTTSGFDDVKILEYYEPITAHVVVGMNFFLDFFGGLTDILGGKSSSYQNTLSSINHDVITELRKKADSIGANCILGFKIDNGEISGQGKSMMMVSATGTPAWAEFNRGQSENYKNSILLRIKDKIQHMDIDQLHVFNLGKQLRLTNNLFDEKYQIHIDDAIKKRQNYFNEIELENILKKIQSLNFMNVNSKSFLKDLKLNFKVIDKENIIDEAIKKRQNYFNEKPIKSEINSDLLKDNLFYLKDNLKDDEIIIQNKKGDELRVIKKSQYELEKELHLSSKYIVIYEN